MEKHILKTLTLCRGPSGGMEGPLSPDRGHHVEREPERNPAFYVTSHFFKVQITFKHFEGHTNPAIGPCLATFGSRVSGCQGLRPHLSPPTQQPHVVGQVGINLFADLLTCSFLQKMV